jgi:hypothetical protein
LTSHSGVNFAEVGSVANSQSCEILSNSRTISGELEPQPAANATEFNPNLILTTPYLNLEPTDTVTPNHRSQHNPNSLAPVHHIPHFTIDFTTSPFLVAPMESWPEDYSSDDMHAVYAFV